MRETQRDDSREILVLEVAPGDAAGLHEWLDRERGDYGSSNWFSRVEQALRDGNLDRAWQLAAAASARSVARAGVGALTPEQQRVVRSQLAAVASKRAGLSAEVVEMPSTATGTRPRPLQSEPYPQAETEPSAGSPPAAEPASRPKAGMDGWQRRLLLIVAVSGVFAIAGTFAYWVWPTPYRYAEMEVANVTVPVRIHRATGQAEALVPSNVADRFSPPDSAPVWIPAYGTRQQEWLGSISVIEVVAVGVYLLLGIGIVTEVSRRAWSRRRRLPL